MSPALRSGSVAGLTSPVRHLVFSSPAVDVAVSLYSCGSGVDHRWSIAGQVYADEDEEFTVIVQTNDPAQIEVNTDAAGEFTVHDLEVDGVQLAVIGDAQHIEVGTIGPDLAAGPS